MFKLIDKKIITILRKIFLLNWPYASLRYILTVLNPESKLILCTGFVFVEIVSLEKAFRTLVC